MSLRITSGLITPGRIFALALLLLVIRALFAYPDVDARFMAGDNDDQMRLVMVRDWLGGQSWFDTQQYRLLPPEGVSMHWSRYVDAGIAALLLPLSALFGAARGEAMTLVLWPSLLLLGLVALVLAGSRQLFGRIAAIGAVLTALIWSRLGGQEFAPARIDHHSVQLLFSTAVAILAVIETRRPLWIGALAGLAAALALAVGLEMLPVIALIWGVAGLRVAFGPKDAGAWLGGFALAIALAAPLLMIGQTARVEWSLVRCDELALPVLLADCDRCGGLAVQASLPVGSALRPGCDLSPWVLSPVLDCGLPRPGCRPVPPGLMAR